jgi:hypothetical protein
LVPTLQPTNDGPYKLHTADLVQKHLFLVRLPIPDSRIKTGYLCTSSSIVVRKYYLIQGIFNNSILSVNIKMDLQEVGVGCGDWIESAQDRDR